MSLNIEQSLSSNPWCQTYLDDPSYTRGHGMMRNSTSDTYDTLICKTLNTPSRIRAVTCLTKRLEPESQHVQTITFMSLGSDMNGHVDTAHGGATATILDEVAGYTMREANRCSGDSEYLFVTGSLNIKYLKPLRTPQVVLIKGTTALGVEGKKKTIIVSLENEHQVIATGEAVFIKVQKGVL